MRRFATMVLLIATATTAMIGIQTLILPSVAPPSFHQLASAQGSFPAPPGGGVAGPFGTVQECGSAFRKLNLPPGWHRKCIKWSSKEGGDDQWYLIWWPPSGQQQPHIVFNVDTYMISDSVMLIMQGDGNLVLYDWVTFQPLWATGTNGRGAYSQMQSDGNLVVYDRNNRAVWASNTCCRSDAWLAIQDDANLVIYNGGHPIWATHTNR